MTAVWQQLLAFLESVRSFFYFDSSLLGEPEMVLRLCEVLEVPLRQLPSSLRSRPPGCTGLNAHSSAPLRTL